MPEAKRQIGSRDPEEFQSPIPEIIVVNKRTLLGKSCPKTTIQKRRLNKNGGTKAGRLYYTDNEKMDVVCKYAVCGNSRTVADHTDVPEGTIRSWKTTQWWNDIMERIHKEEDEELDTKLTKLVNNAVTVMNERLENGDEVYNPRLDEFRRKKVSAKDAGVVAAIGLDKRQLLRGQPTSRVAKVGENERLKKLQEQFQQFTKMKTIEQEPEIEEEVFVIEPEKMETINEIFPRD